MGSHRQMVQEAADYQIESQGFVNPWTQALLDKMASGEVREDNADDPASSTYQENRRPAGGARGGNGYGSFTVRHASDKQVKFASKLLAERVVPESHLHHGAIMAHKAGTANLRQTRDLITFLLTLPVRAGVVASDGATDKQVALIAREAPRRVNGQKLVDTVASVPMTRKLASDVINALLALPFVPREVAAAVVLESGIYRKANGDVFKVYWNQAKTHMLAKKLHVTDGAASWEYAGAAQRFAQPDERMSLEDAKAFGVIYGVCCNCGRTLTDEGSIEAGIGPVCAKAFR